ncbi:MAG: hypothetical protein ACI9P5_003620 [Saprospiraceae bacterium]
MSISLGLNGTESIVNQMEIRISTYESTLDNSIGGFAGNFGLNLAIRKYVMELQGYYLKFKMKKLGSIELGSKFSYLIRSDVSGSNFTAPGINSEINSNKYVGTSMLVQVCWYKYVGTSMLVQVCWYKYVGTSMFYVSILGKYSPGAIKLNDRHKIKPFYTFSYSFNKDVNSIVINSRLINHIFEVAHISELSPKNGNK